ncbi:MAG: G-D-S-L family lipolytic protein [Chitinophagaceae bacterium]|nr:MAG: G-D-S-L family lipolytic protein [Chitinophagaceae bacterium]
MKLRKALAYIFLSILLTTVHSLVYAQPFAKEIAEFKKQDSAHYPAAGQILLIGSSSFTRWTDVQDYFPSYPILNRGFGGSTIPDVTLYVEDVVFRYAPKQIIVYCGENDMVSDTVTAEVVLNRFKQLFTTIRSRLQRVPIVYISMKPSPSRELIQGKVREGNALIRAFLKKQKRATFIDVYKEMIDDEGKPMPDLFVEDNLHMNKKGYAIWQKMMEPHLMKK